MKGYDYLLNLKSHNNYLIIIVFILVLVLFTLALKIDIYDIYDTYATYDNNGLEINLSYLNSDAVLKGDFCKFDNDNYKYQYNILKISKLNEDDTIDVKINYPLRNKLLENEIIHITFYYNQEKIIKKIVKAIF